MVQAQLGVCGPPDFSLGVDRRQDEPLLLREPAAAFPNLQISPRFVAIDVKTLGWVF
jgi:hypothetical protein